MPTIRKKLIEVSIPLEAINKASAREKSIRHGHPSTLHLWWARRPLAACRAVLFAQLVDDPSSWPDRFPTEEAQDKERARLHRVIERLVPWEVSNNETILNDARWEIARSVAWGLGEEPPPQQDTRAILDYLQTKAPPVYDPFSGGGSIPLEAQRLGLRAYGSDLNPVAVLIGKALVEIPPKFAGQPPVNPKAQAELKRSGGTWTGKGAQGLAEDVRFYGQWMRDEAEKRIGHLYPKAKLADGSEATVIAWLWARTVRSPDPAAKGAMVPLVSSFMLSTKPGKKAWVEVVIDADAPDGWRFEVKSGVLSKADEDRLKAGTIGRSTGGTCALTGVSMPFAYLREQGQQHGLGVRLMAIVCEGSKSRFYLSPSKDHEDVGKNIDYPWEPEGELAHNPRNFNTPIYGLRQFSDLFTARQKLALTTYCDLISEVRAEVESNGFSVYQNKGQIDGAVEFDSSAYANAISAYLGLSVSKLAAAQSTMGLWSSSMDQAVNAFGRQAIPMTWDFPESNIFNEMAGDIQTTIRSQIKVISNLPATGQGSIFVRDARQHSEKTKWCSISSDPPYYDNIIYADLSDFFYSWLRPSQKAIFPDLFRRLATPKDEELVASQYRQGNVTKAENFFLDGMQSAISGMLDEGVGDAPLALYYAFKQAEIAQDGLTSAGWSSFLQAIINSGFLIDGTWPLRTERDTGLKSAMNALASSIVLVCRKRAADAPVITRADFIRLLKRELPDAIEDIRKAGVGPVDMQQSVIGPGMGVFSRHARVLEDDDSAMSVKTALAIINRIWGEIENEADASLDPESQVALAWFASYGFDAKPSGELITLANAKNVGTDALYKSGVFTDLRGKAELTAREKLPEDWSPAADATLTIWECVQHAARVFNAEDGGEIATARMIAEMGSKAADARALAYRLFQIATDKGWAAEALVYNELAADWPRLEALAGDLATAAPVKPTQATLDL